MKRPLRLRMERREAGLSQMELARFSGVHQSTISRLESGQLPYPSFEVLHQIAWALKKCGRPVTALDLVPKRPSVLVRGALTSRRRA